MVDPHELSLDRAAKAIARADALLVTAGAGMGVDSGLPDFRGTEGFWKAYPPIAKLGLSFAEMANPDWFYRDPTLAWGFYGHRLHLYQDTAPHAGFARLREWAEARPRGGFVFTSNVDGHFQRAGFSPDRLVECHGALGFLQCREPCSDELWPVGDIAITVDPDSLRATSSLPRCRQCDSLARPNVLMFGDGQWVPRRTAGQHDRLAQWLKGIAGQKLTIIELGAGGAVPTVRRMSEEVQRHLAATLIRINPREAATPSGQIAIPLGARDALDRIAARMM